MQPGVQVLGIPVGLASMDMAVTAEAVVDSAEVQVLGTPVELASMDMAVTAEAAVDLTGQSPTATR